MLGKRLLVLFVLVSLCQLVVSEKLALSDKNRSANVSVSAKNLVLNVESGQRKDYSSSTGRDFGLMIGGCDVRIVGALYIRNILFGITVNNKAGNEKIDDLKSIAVDKDTLTFTGVDASRPKSFSSSVNFVAVDKKFVVSLALSGDVPPNFKLTSDAEIYVEEKKEVSKAGLMLLLYIGAPLLGLAIFMSIGSTVGFFIRRRQKRAESKRLEDEKIAAENLAAEKLTAEKLAAEKLAAEKLAAEKLVAEKEKAELEKAKSEKLAAEKLASEKLAKAKRLEEEKLAAEKKAKDKKLEEEKLALKKLAKIVVTAVEDTSSWEAYDMEDILRQRPVFKPAEVIYNSEEK